MKRTHATCHHRIYGLDCATFEKMIERAGDLCEICRKPPSTPVRGLQIDHDHEAFIVRGLLCPRCNTHLALVASGKHTLTEADSAYLANPFERTVNV